MDRVKWCGALGGALAWVCLSGAPAALASTGTAFQCKVEGEADVQVYLDSDSKIAVFEQGGKTSVDARVNRGVFAITFAGASFEFALSGTEHTGKLKITRASKSRTGACS